MIAFCVVTFLFTFGMLKFLKDRGLRYAKRSLIGEVLYIRTRLPRLLGSRKEITFHLRGGLKTFPRNVFTCGLRSRLIWGSPKSLLFGERRNDGVHVAINTLIAVNRVRDDDGTPCSSLPISSVPM